MTVRSGIFLWDMTLRHGVKGSVLIGLHLQGLLSSSSRDSRGLLTLEDEDLVSI